MVRTGSLQGDLPAVSHCPAMHGMTYREYAAMRRYAPVRVSGMARYGSVRRGSGVRRFASPFPAGGGTGP